MQVVEFCSWYAWCTMRREKGLWRDGLREFFFFFVYAERVGKGAVVKALSSLFNIAF